LNAKPQQVIQSIKRLRL